MRRAMGILCGLLAVTAANAQQTIDVNSWKMQDATRVSADGNVVSTASFDAQSWYDAVVPGTVLTTLVANKVYPEPLYGENMRAIPESLNKTNYWYRSIQKIPRDYRGRHVWLHFAGINYAAAIWVNGTKCGEMRGAFLRGDFDITRFVKPGRDAVIAVRVSPQPHPGVQHEHTVALGEGPNGGETAIDGPTFLSTIGWDWLPAVRDRDTGIWLPVTLSSSGPVLIGNTSVRSELSNDYRSAGISIESVLQNHADHPVTGTLEGAVLGQPGDIRFERTVTVGAHDKQAVAFTPVTDAVLDVHDPKLWWPNGLGPQNLAHLTLTFREHSSISDQQQIQFGIRRITYTVPDSENLTLSVNGQRLMVRGGDWGLDEGLKRIPHDRLEAQFRMHALANMNMIRNWVGQSTSPDFYDLADKYGILLWDEFFQPNPNDGPDPTDIPTYIANVTDKVLRYRNHPSIAVWCARNEGYPPKALDDQLRSLMATLDPTRLYQSNSADGRGVSSHGPYYWRSPRFFYSFNESFKTETGSVSIPTLESIKGMLPERDWETINDDWAQHDMARGAERGDEFPHTLALRYGHIRNLSDFARKGAAATYEAFRAMYEGRNAQMFKTTTGVLTWMSHPAQPSFVWQIYHYDLEPTAALYAVKSAAEPIHIQLNEQTFTIEIVNNQPADLRDLTAHITIYAADSTISSDRRLPVADAPALTTTEVGMLQVNARISPLYFVQLRLEDSQRKVVSENFYWQNVAQDDLSLMEQLPRARVSVTAQSRQEGARTILTVQVHNGTSHIAILTHLQLRCDDGRRRVLPAFVSENYFSLVPGEDKVLTIDANTADLAGTEPILYVDGFNVEADESPSPVAVRTNIDANPQNSPATHLVD